MTGRPRRLHLDPVRPERRARLAGWALLAAGLAAAAAVGVGFHRTLEERARLDAALDAIPRPHLRAPGPEEQRAAEQAAAVERELSIPWTRLLADLEAAAHDSASTVSLLLVEPDPAKRRVRITAEARDLPDALAYLRRLQQSEVLRYPMLESHERSKDDPEHPVRITLLAEWRT